MSRPQAQPALFRRFCVDRPVPAADPASIAGGPAPFRPAPTPITMNTNSWIPACALFAAAAMVAQAATLLDIRTLPVGPVMGPPNTGPIQDPMAWQG